MVHTRLSLSGVLLSALMTLGLASAKFSLPSMRSPADQLKAQLDRRSLRTMKRAHGNVGAVRRSAQMVDSDYDDQKDMMTFCDPPGNHFLSSDDSSDSGVETPSPATSSSSSDPRPPDTMEGPAGSGPTRKLLDSRKRLQDMRDGRDKDEMDEYETMSYPSEPKDSDEYETMAGGWISPGGRMQCATCTSYMSSKMTCAMVMGVEKVNVTYFKNADCSAIGEQMSNMSKIETLHNITVGQCMDERTWARLMGGGNGRGNGEKDTDSMYPYPMPIMDEKDEKYDSDMESDMWGKRDSDMYGKRDSDMYGKPDSDMYGKNDSDMHRQRDSDMYRQQDSDMYRQRDSDMYRQQDSDMYHEEYAMPELFMKYECNGDSVSLTWYNDANCTMAMGGAMEGAMEDTMGDNSTDGPKEGMDLSQCAMDCLDYTYNDRGPNSGDDGVWYEVGMTYDEQGEFGTEVGNNCPMAWRSNEKAAINRMCVDTAGGPKAAEKFFGDREMCRASVAEADYGNTTDATCYSRMLTLNNTIYWPSNQTQSLMVNNCTRAGDAPAAVYFNSTDCTGRPVLRLTDGRQCEHCREDDDSEEEEVPECVTTCSDVQDYEALYDQEGELTLTVDNLMTWCEFLNTTECLATCDRKDMTMVNEVLSACVLPELEYTGGPSGGGGSGGGGSGGGGGNGNGNGGNKDRQNLTTSTDNGVTGQQPIAVPMTDPVLVTEASFPTLNIATLDQEAFKTSFQMGMATAAGVAAENVKVLDIRAGSVIVRSEIRFPSSEDAVIFKTEVESGGAMTMGETFTDEYGAMNMTVSASPPPTCLGQTATCLGQTGTWHGCLYYQPGIRSIPSRHHVALEPGADVSHHSSICLNPKSSVANHLHCKTLTDFLA